MVISLTSLRDRYLRAQLDGDRQAAVRVLVDEGLGRGVTTADLVLGVVQPAQHEIGRLWQENVITVAEEHLATAISQVALARLWEATPRQERNGRQVVVACVEGERHELGARVVSDFLDSAGFEVRYLGADVPTKDLVSLVRDRRPGLVALSVAMAHNLPAADVAVTRLCEATDGEVPVAVGGAAFGGTRLPDGAAFTCANARELVHRARDLMGV